MDYDKLTQAEALDILKNDYNQRLVENFEEMNQIIDAPSVLYYADAYGDVEDAMYLQRFDKSLPDRVYDKLLESGLDLLEAMECHDMETMSCPSCDADIWQFEINQGNGHNSHELMDEHNGPYRHETFVSSPDSWYWNANQQDDHCFSLCGTCSVHISEDFRDDTPDVTVHYGATDEISGFSTAGNIVRWDFEWLAGHRDQPEWTELWGVPGDDPCEIASEWVKGNQTELMNDAGWDEIAWSQVKDALDAYASVHKRGSKRSYRDIIKGWANPNGDGDDTHPDLDFTYALDFTSFGTPSLWVADENRDDLMEQVVDQIERRN
jgi:hypothetical protein